MILNILNQLHEAKQGNSLSPDMLSYALKCTHNLFYRKTMLGGMTSESKDRYVTNASVTSEMFTYGNHQNLIPVNKEFQDNIIRLDQYFITGEENRISKRVA